MTSALTEIDQPELVDRILTLARDGDLRRRMGQAAQAHVRAHYDWSVIVPQMQALWAEQEAMRVAAKPLRYRSDSLPIAPSPTHYFAAYPTEQVTLKDQLFVAVDGGPDLQALLRIRNYTATKRMFAPPPRLARSWRWCRPRAAAILPPSRLPAGLPACKRRGW